MTSARTASLYIGARRIQLEANIRAMSDPAAIEYFTDTALILFGEAERWVETTKHPPVSGLGGDVIDDNEYAQLRAALDLFERYSRIPWNQLTGYGAPPVESAAQWLARFPDGFQGGPTSVITTSGASTPDVVLPVADVQTVAAAEIQTNTPVATPPASDDWCVYKQDDVLFAKAVVSAGVRGSVAHESGHHDLALQNITESQVADALEMVGHYETRCGVTLPDPSGSGFHITRHAAVDFEVNPTIKYIGYGVAGLAIFFLARAALK